MRVFRFIFLGMAVSISASLGPAQERPEDGSARPNIVFICTDDQGQWAVGANGNRDVQTPNMDRLHREGVSIPWAFVSTPVCSPSRAGLMTGLHSVQSGVTDWIEPKDQIHGINPKFVTWPETLHAAGYVTGYIGKWHLGTQPWFHPRQNGFDYFMGLLVGGAEPISPTLEIHGIERRLTGAYSVEFVTDDALHFLRQNANVPFLLMLEFREPHTPYGPMPPADTARYASFDPKVPDVPGIDGERYKRAIRDYYAAVSAVDRNIGRVLDLLDELGLARNTIVVFTSDNGYMIGHHGLWHKGNATIFDRAGEPMLKDPERRRPNMFDESIRVPLAIRWPAKIKPGSVFDGLFMQLDFYPTLLSLVGVPMPELPSNQPAQGIDYSAALLGKAGGPPPRDTVFCDYDMTDGKFARMRMIRTREWKLVKHYEEVGGADELYDLKNDPAESRNLFSSPPDAGILDRLERDLVAWQKRVGDPLLRSEEFRRRQAALPGVKSAQ